MTTHGQTINTKNVMQNKTIKQNYISPSLEIIGIALESTVLLDSGYECKSAFLTVLRKVIMNGRRISL